MHPVTAPECCECDHTDSIGTVGHSGYAEDVDLVFSGDAMRPNTDVDYFLDQLDRVLAEQ